ncbi:MAG: NADPH cytochrome P450 oxidoreductase family protein [Asticcacaulis sp.]
MWGAFTSDLSRWYWAGAWLAFFAMVCVWSAFKGRKKPGGTGDYLVLYASQTGQAEMLARQTERALLSGGLDAQVMSLSEVTQAHLLAARHIMCIVSTTGDGDAPDEGLRFEREMMSRSLDLSQQTLSVLALGDRKYPQFCAFGQRFYDWGLKCGAIVPDPLVMADDLDAQALQVWQDVLRGLGAQGNETEDEGRLWQLQARERLNPLGKKPLYRLSLTGTGDWQAGDLIEIITPTGHRRDYSIATLPQEGRIDLFVRQIVGTDGQLGEGSGLLTEGLAVGEKVRLLLKSHRGFHLPEGDGPLLLIGAGSGLAGLRAHILQAFATKRACWLIYGEGHPEADGALCQEMRDWQYEGVLQRLELAFSRPDQRDGQYVQALVSVHATDIPAYLGQTGAVMVCGGLSMGLAVEKALIAALGEAWIEDAKVSGRYRRDLY